MGIVVCKYGGTSVADVARVRRVAASVAEVHAAGASVVVVVSAQGATTDELLRRSAELGGGAASRETDQLLVTGECASAAQLAIALESVGTPAVSLTGAQAGIVVTGPPGAGLVSGVDTTRIRSHLAAGRVVVVAGFHGVNGDGDVVTLGRGGSDTTAVALAAALDADSCEIYSDVDGVASADPRTVTDARVLPELSSAMAMEMAFTGATVLHARAAELAAVRDIELRVRSSMNDGPGTTIAGDLERHRVTAVTHDLDVARVLVRSDGPRRDLAVDVLSVLAAHNAPLDLVARSGAFESEFRMGFTMRRGDLRRVASALRDKAEAVGGTVTLDEDVAKVSVIGVGLLSRPEYVARLLSTLSGAGIATSWLFTSQLRVSVTVHLARALDAVALLHEEFAVDANPSLATS